ncbi:MAG TPA: DUF4142 domain-containing protein [Candidatus Acidoferrum sp.]|nr:DUF4142 domain-containing protein [Candidatus Acidoferrum sp.]
MKKYLWTGITAAAALCLLAGQRLRAADEESGANRGQFSKTDYKFACEAARGGMMEVKAGQLAQTQGYNLAVKQFGERMVTDHSKVNDQLKALVSQKGAMLPASLGHKDQRTLDALAKLSGKEFDRTYAADMVKDHKEDIKAFQKEAESADDPALRAFARNTVPILTQHLQMAEQMKAAVDRENQTAGP